LARALMKSFGAVPKPLAGTHQAELSQRLSYIEQNVLLEAQAILVQHLASGNKDNAVIAANLLSKIGGEREFNLLSVMAKSEPDLKLRQAAFNGAWGSVYRTAPAGYGETTSYLDKQAILEFLVSQAALGAKSRDSA